jgi:RNA polymerase sigma factor (sigma-70 family)
MPAKQLQGVIHHLRRTVGARGLREVPDAELLKRFLADRDEAAFELLVWRHGKMVFNVCCRISGDEHEAEDAFQATFLVLARKAGSISKCESVGGWLYKVAYRVAQTARLRAAQRTGRLQPSPDLESIPGTADPVSSASWREVRLLIDDELHHLPEKYRLPFILCHLEGHSNADAAHQLGCPVGTVESRLTRARQRLRSGLARRGVTLSAGISAALLTTHAASACASAELVLATVKAATLMAAGEAVAGLISAKVAALTEGVLKTMLATKLKIAAAVVLTVGLLAGGVGGLGYHSLASAADEDDSSKITTKDADAERIAKLIDQLGSDTFADRETASRELERLGAAALEALRQAAQSQDLETRRRAQALVTKIEKEQTSRDLLQAKSVRLRLKDTPLPEAVAELAKQSGYEIVLDDPDGKLKERTVTLDTGEVPFWRAVDLLCRAGGVVEAQADGAIGMPMLPGGAGGVMLPGAPGGGLPMLPKLPAPGLGAPKLPVGGGGQPGAKSSPAVPAGAAPPPGEQLPKQPQAGAQPKGAAVKIPPPAAPAPGDQAAPAAAQPAAKAPPAAATPPAGQAPPFARQPAQKIAPPAPAGGGVVAPPAIAGPGGGLPAGFVLRAPPGMAGANVPIAPSRLVLKDGKPATSPTAYVGAARVRAVTGPPQFAALPAREGESDIGLQFSLEPRLVWRRLTALRLDKAVDDQDQTLEQALASDNGPAAGVGGIGGPGGGIAFRGAPGHDFDICSGVNLYSSLRLKKGEKPAKSLKQLKGTLTAEILGPIKPIITVDNLLDAAGKKCKGNEGGSLEVLEVVRGEDGEITVKLAIDPPAESVQGMAAAGAVMVAPAGGGGAVPPPPLPAGKLPAPPAAPAGGAVAIGGFVRTPGNGHESEISLVDTKGKVIETTRHTLSYRGGEKGFTHMHEFAFRLPKEREITKLVFSGRRPATIDLPFTLKDVPLP